ncbi:rhodanese-like domain-containing protein [Bacteroidota bacterium]
MDNQKISFRVQVSILLVCFAALALIMPDKHRSVSELRPSEMILKFNNTDMFLSCDQIARSLVYEDTSLQLVDIRDSLEYISSHIPGAINIPFRDIINPDWSGYLDDPGKTAVLYENNNVMASEAWMLCTQLGYHNVTIMKGGMNKWYEEVMKSEFSGERITAAENALFEVRYRARDFFTTMNSLPDSLKIAYLQVKKKKEAELVGGCE